MDMHDRLSSLYSDVSQIESAHSVGWPVGQVYNALLAQAKQDHADDPVVAALEPLQVSGAGSNIAGMNAGTLRALMGQLLNVYSSD